MLAAVMATWCRTMVADVGVKALVLCMRLRIVGQDIPCPDMLASMHSCSRSVLCQPKPELAALQATFAAYELDPVHPTKPSMKSTKIWPGAPLLTEV